MKLPLDIFQLLGVPLNADRKKILTILEKRLDICLFKGVSEKTLEDRKGILVTLSQILIDPEKRIAYDSIYLKGSTEILENKFEVSHGQEIAGLLLLLEADQAQDCIEIGNKLYGEWKSNIGINNQAYQDLMLIIDHAAIVFANQLRVKRYYESAAEVLQKRIRPVESLSLKELQEKLRSELEDLLPYRILDLLSRNTSDQEHERGRQMLEQMVLQRGGLENDSTCFMSNTEFQAFFRQIRWFLTVQEQIDLFNKWSLRGSNVASFLTSITLTASGFSQRKPERLVEALHCINRIGTSDLETIKANIYLLLGNVERANDLLTRYADVELDKWCKENGESRLAQQCAWCREWLARDVLIGYRDIETEPDLEAYFSDRDVTTYIESQDTNSIDNRGEDSGKYSIGLIDNRSEHNSTKDHLVKRLASANLDSGKTINKMINIKNTLLNNNNLVIIITLLMAIVTGIVIMLGQRTKIFQIKNNSELTRKGFLPKESLNISTIPVPKKRVEDRYNEKNGSLPLSNEEKLYKVLTEWLQVKVQTLAGNPIPESANKFASLSAIARLEEERRSNIKRGESLKIKVSVLKVKIISKSENKIRIRGALDYEDKRVNQMGKMISKTPRYVFFKEYTLVKDRDRWIID